MITIKIIMMIAFVILVVSVVAAYRPRTRPLALALAFRSGVAIIVESNSSRASLNPRWYSESTAGREVTSSVSLASKHRLAALVGA